MLVIFYRYGVCLCLGRGGGCFQGTHKKDPLNFETLVTQMFPEFPTTPLIVVIKK